MKTNVYNVTITIKSVQTEDPKKLEQEVWRICSIINLMFNMCDEDAVYLFGGVCTSMELVE